MAAAEVIIWITVILVFIILFGTIIYLLSRDSNPPEETDSTDPKISPPIEPPDPTGFLYSCETDADCQENLGCDTFWGQCKMSNNKLCHSSFDCLTGSFCSGVCLDKSFTPNVVSGDANDPCPCQLGFGCTNSVSIPDRKVCLKFEGIPCTQGKECISGKCNTLFEIPICSGPRRNGESCEASSQCDSQNCSKGYCQNPGLITGELNSFCASNNPPTCNSGLICSVANTCVEATNGLLYPCNEVVGCPAYFSCYYLPDVDANGKYKAPGTSGGFQLCKPTNTDSCTCLFSTDVNTALPNPNHQSTTNACVSWQVPVTESGNKVCKSKAKNPCSGGITSTVNGGCANGTTCNHTPGFYRIETTFSGDDNCYPLPGVVGTTDISYEKIELPPSVIPAKIIGTTINFSVPRDSSGNISIENCSQINKGVDKVYILTTTGKTPNPSIPDNQTVIWGWSSASSQAGWSPILTYKFTDRVGTSYQFVNATSTTILASNDNSERLLIAGLILTGSNKDKMAILLYNFVDGSIFPYITISGIPVNDSGDVIDFDDLSATDAQKPGNSFASILLINTAAVKIYYNEKDVTFVDRSPRIPEPSKNPIEFQLNYGLIQDLDTGVFTSFPVMTCITGDNGNRFVRFSQGLGYDVIKTYVNVKYPSPMYGSAFSSTNVRSYSFAQVNPLKFGFQHGIFSSFTDSDQVPTIYTFSTGSLSAIPGYTTNSAKFLATTANLYVFSLYNCA